MPRKKTTECDVELTRRHDKVNLETGEVETWADIREIDGYTARLIRNKEEDFSRPYASIFLQELESFLGTRPTSTEMMIFLHLLTKMRFANEVETTRAALAKELKASRNSVITAMASLEAKHVIVTRREMCNSRMREIISVPIADMDRLNLNLVWRGKPSVNNRLVRGNVHPHINTQINDIRIQQTQINITDQRQVSVTNIGKVDTLQVNIVAGSPEDVSKIDLDTLKRSLQTENVNIILEGCEDEKSKNDRNAP